jgi:hypothetical protein
MSDDLARLGAALEAATGHAVRRRRVRWQTARGLIASVALAVPVVLGATQQTLEPAAGPLPRVPAITDPALWPPTFDLMVRHIPDENAESVVHQPCLDARDCRAPIRPTRQPAPPGRV